MDLARSMIDGVAVPMLRKVEQHMNECLSPHGVRLGLEVTWLIDRIEPEKEGESD